MTSSEIASCLYCVPYQSSVRSVFPSKDLETIATLKTKRQSTLEWMSPRKDWEIIQSTISVPSLGCIYFWKGSLDSYRVHLDGKYTYTEWHTKVNHEIGLSASLNFTVFLKCYKLELHTSIVAVNFYFLDLILVQKTQKVVLEIFYTINEVTTTLFIPPISTVGYVKTAITEISFQT